MEDCIFCKIASGQIPCAKVWENDKFLAFLDIHPVMKGMTLVIPKEHHDSYIFNQDDSLILETINAAKNVSKMLETALNVSRVALVAEGTGVNHFHLKLYPLHGFKDDYKFEEPKEGMYFEKYEGYVSTQGGPQKSSDELNQLAQQIASANTTI